MLYIFNECATPQWKIIDKGNQLFSIALASNEKFAIDIKLREEDKFLEDGLQTINDTRDLTLLLDAPTAVRFNSRNLQPKLIIPKNDFNCDFYIVSFDISDGYKLINQMRKNAYIYMQYYNYEQHQVHMILSLNVTAERSYVEDVFQKSDGSTVMMKHLMWYPKYNKVSIISREGSVEKIKKLKRGDRGYIDLHDNSNGNMYDLHTFVPMRPTALIVVENEKLGVKVKEMLEKSYHTDPKYTTMVHFDEIPYKDYRKACKKYVSKGFTAVTFYNDDIAHDDLKDAWDEIRRKYMDEFCGKFFNTALLLTGDGRVSRIH